LSAIADEFGWLKVTVALAGMEKFFQSITARGVD